MRGIDDRATGLLILRVAAGLVFLLHGWEKLFGDQISFVQEMLTMAGWSLPAGLLWGVAVLEVIGGLALLAGVFTRVAGFVLAVEMVVAVVLFHLRQGFFIVAVPNAPLAYGFEFHAVLVGALICLALAGPGRWSLAGRLNSGRTTC